MLVLISPLALLFLNLPQAAASGLTLTRFSNTAHAGAGDSTEVLQSLDDISDCEQNKNCGGPSSFLLTGRLQPTSPGLYGFNVTLDPPTPYPSAIAYARLWVNDHLLFPPDTVGGKGGGGGRRAPLYIPLPPRALTGTGLIAAAASLPPATTRPVPVRARGGSGM